LSPSPLLLPLPVVRTPANPISSTEGHSPSSPVSPSFFDAPSNISTSQPSPLSPTSAKAACAASNIQKVQKKIAAKAATHGKKKKFVKRYMKVSSSA
jgi:hypothetical protein